MRTTVFLCLLSLLSVRAVAQATIPFEFTSEEDNRLIKENDSAKLYVASGDTSNIVAINEEASTYQLLNKKKKVIAEGAFTTEGDKYLQEGKWTENYDGGKAKLTGYYHKSKPYGTWWEFYPNGEVKTVYNYAVLKDADGSVITCLSGSYQEFYPTGKLKTNGFYAAVLIDESDEMVVEDPISGKKITETNKHSGFKAQKTGQWEYYGENGEVEKKEEL